VVRTAAAGSAATSKGALLAVVGSASDENALKAGKIVLSVAFPSEA